MLQFTEFVKACLFVLSHSVMSDCDYMDYSPPGSFVHEDSPGKNTGVDLPFPPPGDLPNPGIKPSSPTLQVDSLPSEPPGKAHGVGKSQTQLSNWRAKTWIGASFLTEEFQDTGVYTYVYFEEVLHPASHCTVVCLLIAAPFFLNSFPSLISSYLNLPFGTQRSSRRVKPFSYRQEMGTWKEFVPRTAP